MTVRAPCDEGIIYGGRAAATRDRSVGRGVLAATIIGSSIIFIDGTVVNVALPVLQSELGGGVAGAQWIVEAYALMLAALILVGGSLGDLYGRRRVFAIGVALFAAASLWCALAPSLGQLIAARAAQGLGGAMLVPGSLALISASFPKEERGRAIGTWSGYSAIAAGLGPLVGGWLIENVSWRSIFFINLPLAFAVLLIVWRYVPESRDDVAERRLDWWGATLASVGLGGVVYGLIESNRLGFGDWRVVTSLALGAMALASFVIVERRSRQPMMPLDLFRSRTFTGANLLTFFLYGALGGLLFFFPFNLIQVQGYSATAAGAAFLPFVLTMFLLSRWAGGLVTRYGSRLPLMVGPLIAAAGFALFSLPGADSRDYWTSFFPAIAVMSLGMAISVAPLTTTVMGSVDERHAGIASGVNNAVSRTAGLLAVAVLGVFMVNTFKGSFERRLATLDLPPEVRRDLERQRTALAGIEIPPGPSRETEAAIQRAVLDSFVDGFRVLALIAAALALSGAVTAWLTVAVGREELDHGAARRRQKR